MTGQDEKLSSEMLELLEQDEVQEALKPEFTNDENSWAKHLLGGVMYVSFAAAYLRDSN